MQFTAQRSTLRSLLSSMTGSDSLWHESGSTGQNSAPLTRTTGTVHETSALPLPRSSISNRLGGSACAAPRCGMNARTATTANISAGTERGRHRSASISTS